MKTVFAALVGVFLSLLLKDRVPKIAFCLSAVCGVMILTSVAEDLSEIINFASGAFSGSDVFELLLKATGIAYITDFAADLFRDAGENGNAKRLELAGKISVVAMALPVIGTLFEKVKDVFT